MGSLHGGESEAGPPAGDVASAEPPPVAPPKPAPRGRAPRSVPVLLVAAIALASLGLSAVLHPYLTTAAVAAAPATAGEFAGGSLEIARIGRTRIRTTENEVVSTPRDGPWPLPRDAFVFPTYAERATPPTWSWPETIVRALAPTLQRPGAFIADAMNRRAESPPSGEPADAAAARTFLDATMPRSDGAPFGDVEVFLVPPEIAYAKATGVRTIVAVAVMGPDFDAARVALAVEKSLDAARATGCDAVALPLLGDPPDEGGEARVYAAMLDGAVAHARSGRGVGTVYLGTWAKGRERPEVLAKALWTAWTGLRVERPSEGDPADKVWRMASVAALAAVATRLRRKAVPLRGAIAIGVLSIGIATVAAEAVEPALSLFGSTGGVRLLALFASAAFAGTMLPAFVAFDAKRALTESLEDGPDGADAS